MRELIKILIRYYKGAEAQKVRSNVISFVGKTEFTYHADISKPYEFEIVNLDPNRIISDNVELIAGIGANGQNSRIYPRVGIFKRNDIINLDADGAPMNGFVIEHLEHTG